MSVLKWFNTRTFHNSAFENVEKLVELKKDQGQRISVGIPTLNEEANVGKVISTIKSELYDKHGLIDEIAIIDSGSEDKTVEIAEKAGAKVIVSEKKLRDQGVFYGKGENLWKSLHVLRGNIICWIDADIENIHPKFVYGLVGPLLTNKEIGYVKGFYERPIKFDGKIVSYGGGRVTELVVRPMFNLYYPELSGFVQPLSGEYAGRRDILEKVPFFVGYGVETGLLIDILEKFGLNAMAQVDLEERVHRNQSISSLGRMAFGIQQVFAKRLCKKKRSKVLKDFSTVFRFPEIHGAGKEGTPREYFLNEKEITEVERPPIKSLPEYKEKLKKEGSDYYAKFVDVLRDLGFK